jgi:hypothetical protein
MHVDLFVYCSVRLYERVQATMEIHIHRHAWSMESRSFKFWSKLNQYKKQAVEAYALLKIQILHPEKIVTSESSSICRNLYAVSS